MADAVGAGLGAASLEIALAQDSLSQQLLFGGRRRGRRQHRVAALAVTAASAPMNGAEVSASDRTPALARQARANRDYDRRTFANTMVDRSSAGAGIGTRVRGGQEIVR